jgi:5'-nucleotidase
MPSSAPSSPSPRRRFGTGLAAATIAALGLTSLVAAPAFAADPVTIDLVSINDFHGRLEAAAPAAGAAVLAGKVNQIRSANPNTVFVAAGDLIGASTFVSYIQQDNPTIDAFNAMGLDVSSFGNHEFDQGRADIDGRVLPRANWPYLAANLYDTTTNQPAFQEYEIKDYGGVSVGFVGAVTEELPSLVSPAGISTLSVKPIVPEINRVAAQLSDGNAANGEADVLVLLVHEGAETATLASVTDGSTRFGSIVNNASPEFDVIVSGHTHLVYNFEVPMGSKTRTVISSGQYGENFADTKLVVDPDTGQVLSAHAQIQPLFNAAPPDPAVATIVANAVATAGPLGNVSLGTITADFRRAKQSAAVFAENRGGESTIGNLIADAQREAAGAGVQLALMNPGGIRQDLLVASSGAGDPDGNVSYKEAALVQPFANTLVTMDITGAQLRTALEQQWQPAGASRPFLRLGTSTGLVYTYNPSAPAGSHIGTITLDGAIVTPTQTIKTVVNSFLAAGGDNFAVLASGANKADTGKVDLQAFVDYMAAHTPLTPSYAQHSVGAVLSPPASGAAYKTGESVTLTLSSLLFSNGGPTTGTATVSLDGTQLGSAPISFTIVDTLDEQGTATVTFTLPATVSGARNLVVGGPGGTSAIVPITIAPPVTTTVLAVPSRFISTTGRNVDYEIKVKTADNSAAVGTVTIYDGHTVLTTVPIAAANNGRLTVRLPQLDRRGVTILTAVFSGPGYVSDRSNPSLVIVL